MMLKEKLFEAIKHGDEAHQKWLMDKLTDFFYENDIEHELEMQMALAMRWQRLAEDALNAFDSTLQDLRKR